ncbi:hypothetical protein [Vampirovibrio chlorellavorus]|uniref:hypothetical protein n=1 Tax=Vampirovibrio chlorellavorus TaxID=758823 RepID=UPI0026EC93DF|nr:hypothetical protein [Vampirovibrio chlorellavorus]
MHSSLSSPGPLPRYGFPPSPPANPVRFQARLSTRQTPQSTTEQVQAEPTNPGPSIPQNAPLQSGYARPLPSVVLGRALPQNGEITGFIDRERATASTLVVIEQPDQPANVQVQGALSAYPPPSTISDSSDPGDGFDTAIETHQTLDRGLAWYLRLFGIVGGTALIIPGALMLSMANQTETPHGPRMHFFSKFLSGFLITSGSAISALAAVSSLNAIHPSLTTRLTSGLRARFRPQAPMARPVVLELPAVHLDA